MRGTEEERDWEYGEVELWEGVSASARDGELLPLIGDGDEEVASKNL